VQVEARLTCSSIILHPPFSKNSPAHGTIGCVQGFLFHKSIFQKTALNAAFNAGLRAVEVSVFAGANAVHIARIRCQNLLSESAER
jgi:hypothetical protein